MNFEKTNPVTRYPHPPFPKEPQNPPGLALSWIAKAAMPHPGPVYVFLATAQVFGAGRVWEQRPTTFPGGTR